MAIARTAKGVDENGYRAEFVDLVKAATRLHKDFRFNDRDK